MCSQPGKVGVQLHSFVISVFVGMQCVLCVCIDAIQPLLCTDLCECGECGLGHDVGEQCSLQIAYFLVSSSSSCLPDCEG